MKALLSAICLGLLASTAAAYWADTPLEHLAAESDVVVIGRVTALLPDTNTLKVKVTLRELMVLKGQVAGDTVSFDAPFNLSGCVIVGWSEAEARAATRENPYAVVRPLQLNQHSLEPDRFQIIAPNSFVTNEYCAVLLKRDPFNLKPGALQLVRGDDGKFALNPATMELHKPMMSKPSFIPLAEFTRIVQASPIPKPPVVISLEPYGPFQTLTNLPVTLILPRAITR